MTPFEYYRHTLDLLMEGHLLKAIRLQKEQIAHLQNWPLMDELVKMEETYTLMLKYFAEGADDERRRDVYTDMIDRVLDMAEKIKRQMGFRDSNSTYYSKLRTIARQGRTLIYYTRRLQMDSSQQLMQSIIDGDVNADLKGENGRTFFLEELFDFIWVMGKMSEEDYDALETLFAGSSLNGGEKMWLVSAVTLSLLCYYDDLKLNLLVNIADSFNDSPTSDNAVLFSRVLVGISLAAMYYRRRFAIRPYDLHFEFKQEIDKAFCMIQLQCLVQYQTQRIRKSFDQDFMSLINQLKGKIGDVDELKNLLEDEDPELPPGIDPDLIRSIQERMKQVSDMAHQGLDMMYYQFRQLKNFPFFRESRNWLKPTSVPTPDFDATLGKLTPLLNLSRLCDSDKHSMAATLSSMPQTFGQLLLTQMKEFDLQSLSAQELMHEERERILATYDTQFPDFSTFMVYSSTTAYATCYLQDLYRYFTIRMEREPEGNPFSASPELLFLDAPLMMACIKPKQLNRISDYALKMHLYRHSLNLNTPTVYPELVRDGALQRSAFCHAMLKDSHSAVEAFRRCEQEGFTLSDDMWALYASCLMSEGQPYEAIRVFRQLFANEESSLSLYSYAVALSQTGQYAEACEVLYQEDFLRPKQIRVVRLLAWVNMKRLALSQEGLDMLAELKDALALYQRLLIMEPLRGADWLNAGHAALACGNVAQAIDYYTRSDITAFSADDRSLLTTLGIPSLTLRLVEDALERE